MANIKLDEIRQTYIFMWHENGVNDHNGVKYIFNRSISWGGISFKRLQPIIDYIGIDCIKALMNKIEKLDDNVGELTASWEYDDDIFKVLEIHSEWDNYQLCDQSKINVRKQILAEENNAIVRKDCIIDKELAKKIDCSINNNIRKKILNYLINIDKRIRDYFHEIYDPYITQFENLQNMIKNKEDELDKLNNQINKNKELLRRQNYVLQHPKKYNLNNYETNYQY